MLDKAVLKIIDTSVSKAMDLIWTRIGKKNDKLAEQASFASNADHVIELAMREAQFNDEIRGRIRLDATLSCIRRHLSSVRAWCGEVNFRDLEEARSISDIFVNLDAHKIPANLRHAEEIPEPLPLIETILASDRNFVVLGGPGAGKTTSMKHLAGLILAEQGQNLKQAMPVVLKLRELEYREEESHPILSRLQQILPMDIDKGEGLFRGIPDTDFGSLIADWYVTYIDQFNFLFILDGYDEIPLERLRQRVMSDIRMLASALISSRIVVTSRTGEFNVALDRSRSMQLAPLKRTQIAEFARNWLGSEVDADDFLRQVEQSPYWDTSPRPILLAHLCAVYSRLRTLPERPKTVYRKVVGLLIEAWDEERSVKRKSKYAKFSPDRKFDFLCHLAFWLTCDTGRAVFGSQKLAEAYSEICMNFRLPRSDVSIVVSEIESHTGLFNQTGLGQFEFVHKSIQEYLCAEHMVRLPNLRPAGRHVGHLGAELAVATAISSNPSMYLIELVLAGLTRRDVTVVFLRRFLTRLLQEDPDFYTERDLILAALCVAHLFRETEPLMEFCGQISRYCDKSVVDRYYEVAQPSSGVIIATKRREHREYILPIVIEVDTEVYQMLIRESYSKDSSEPGYAQKQLFD